MTADVTWFSLWPYLLFALLLFTVLLVCYLIFSRRQSRRSTAAPDVASDPETEQPQTIPDRKASVAALTGQLRRSFAQAHRCLKKHVSGRRTRYRVPWFLLLGEAEAGKTTLMGNLGLHYPLGKPSEERPGIHPPCNWWFFDQGVVLDIAGRVLGRPEGENEPGWQMILHLLRTYRPQRPLDGVILTIPCTELVDLNLQDKTVLSRLQDKAASFYQYLWQAQHRLGMRFPVYILVTKCDELPGFRSWCNNLPESRRQDMVGWSNPYTIESAYMTSWVDEAFDHLNDQLFESQLEIFTVRQEVEERDGVFQFPYAFQTLRTPLRLYLDQLFTQSVYHESFFFRGLYFCGGQRDTASATADRTPVQPLFLRHLFERKILPESRLARPVTRKSAAAHRTMRIAQGLAALLILVGGLGLWHAASRLAHHQPMLLQTLGHLQQGLDKIDEIVKRREQRKQQELLSLGYETQASMTAFTNELQMQSRHTIDEMSRLPMGGLTSLFLPSSWLRLTPQVEIAPLNAAVRRAVARVYHHIILRAMFYRLAVDAEQLAIAPRTTQKQRKPQVHLNILHAHMNELAKLQENYTKLNYIQDEKNVRSLFRNPEVAKSVNELMSTLLGAATQLPKTFFRDPKFYQYIVDEGRTWRYDPNQAASQTDAVRTLAWRYYNSLFHPNAVMENIDGLTGYIQAIEAGEVDGTTFHRLLACMDDLQSMLDAPASQWLTQNEFNPDPRFDDVLIAIQQSPFLGPEISAEIKAGGEAAFQQLKTVLKELESSQASEIGSLLQISNEASSLQLSSTLLSLHTALQQWLRLPFMAVNRTEEPPIDSDASACARVAASSQRFPHQIRLAPTIPHHNRLVWDADLLQEATQLIPQYERFSQKDLKAFPSSWHRTLTEQSLDHLEAHLRTLWIQAQKLVDYPSRTGLADALRIDLKGFQEALKPIDELLQTADQLELVSLYWELLDVVAQYVQHLLPQVDTLLTQEALYTSRDNNFAWWMGDKSLALEAFGVMDAAGLSQYLQAQHQRMTFLATQYAKPLITFLDSYPIDLQQEDAARLARWHNILEELDRYAKQKPGNSVATLEQFILALNDVTPETCLPESSDAPRARQESDYFLQRRDHLRNTLLARCQALTDRIVYEQYQALAEQFTRQLAGRFPFSASQPDQEGVEVSPEAIRAFYQTFDVSAPTIRAILQHHSQFGAEGERVLAFLQQLEAVRHFFAPFIERIGGIQNPVFDLQVAFRVNRQQEINADQIIDWRLQIGDLLLRHYDSKGQPHGRWRYGDPVQLSLRWAKNAPWEPILAGSPNSAQSQNHTIVYRDTSSWSLLRFLRQHAGESTDFEQLVDLHPHTLGFTIATTPVATRSTTRYGVAQAPSRTKAFVRITLLSPDKKDQLVMPVFPIRAPTLPASHMAPSTVGNRQHTAGRRD